MNVYVLVFTLIHLNNITVPMFTPLCNGRQKLGEETNNKTETYVNYNNSVFYFVFLLETSFVLKIMI